MQRVEREQRVLVKVDDLGYNMIFVGKGCSRSWSWRRPQMSDEFFTKNCIYFADRDTGGNNGSRLEKYCLRKNEVESSFSLFHQEARLSCNCNWINPNPI